VLAVWEVNNQKNLSTFYQMLQSGYRCRCLDAVENRAVQTMHCYRLKKIRSVFSALALLDSRPKSASAKVAFVWFVPSPTILFHAKQQTQGKESNKNSLNFERTLWPSRNTNSIAWQNRTQDSTLWRTDVAGICA